MRSSRAGFTRRATAWIVRASLALAALAFTASSRALAGEEEPSEHRAPAEQGALEFHGYGDFHYNNPAIGTMSSSTPSEADIHGLSLEWEYEFTEAIRFEGEVDYEHAGKELEVEEAFLDVDLSPTVTLRTGGVLVPVGPLNEAHEPTEYLSVERPYVEQTIVPTTWQEIGVGLVGRVRGAPASYRVYVVSGLDALRFTAMQGIRDGRGGGAEAKAETVAGVGRIVVGHEDGLSAGGSAYYGGAGQGRPGLDRVFVRIGAVDARYHRGGLDVRALAAGVTLTGAGRVSAFTGETVGSRMVGWLGEAAYDLLRRDRGASRGRALFVFARHERFDTNDRVARGYAPEPAADRRVTTAGAAFYPIPRIAFKADYEHWKDGSGARLDRVNLGLAFRF
ncbi:MAG: hypothetical protein ACM3JJ_08300 [Hyphomicrobiales bacterium]